MSKATKQTALSIILAETVIYGGLLMTRRAVLQEMTREGHDARCVDRFVFGTPRYIEALEDKAVA